MAPPVFQPPPVPDIASLAGLQKTATTTAYVNIAILLVVVGAFLFGGYTVYNRLAGEAAKTSQTKSTKSRSGVPSLGDATSCGEGMTVQTCADGNLVCAPICVGSQMLQCSTSEGGILNAQCVCPDGYITDTQFCDGCIPPSCPTGTGICPAKGVCQCTGAATCSVTIDRNYGIIEDGSKIQDPTCPQKCMDVNACLSSPNAPECIEALNGVCRQSDCEFNGSPDSFEECSTPGSKFDSFNIITMSCQKNFNCTRRNDPVAVNLYGPGTMSNIDTAFLKLKNNASGQCESMTTEDVKNVCLNDNNGCPAGYTFNGTTCVNPQGGTVAPGPTGARPTGTTSYWDGISCYLGGTAGITYNIKTYINKVQTIWYSRNNVASSYTTIEGTVAIPTAYLNSMQYQRLAIQLGGMECSMLTPNYTGPPKIKAGGNSTTSTFAVTDANPDAYMPTLTDQERTTYSLYSINGILGNGSTSPGLYPTQPQIQWNIGSTPLVPYRFITGLLVQRADGVYALKALSESASCPDNNQACTETMGDLMSVSMTQITSAVDLAPPVELSGPMAQRVFSQNTTNTKILDTTIQNFSTTPSGGSLSGSTAEVAPNFISTNQTYPYCIAACNPSFCPMPLSGDIQFDNQFILFAFTVDLSQVAIPFKTTVQQKEDSIYVYLMKNSMDVLKKSVPWATIISDGSTITIDGQRAAFKLSSLASTTDSSGKKYYVIADYVSALKSYRYDIGYFWGSAYLSSVQEGKGSWLRTFMVNAPAYTKETCWAIPFKGPGAGTTLPSNMIYNPQSGKCVGPNTVTDPTKYGTNAPYEFYANMMKNRQGTPSFSSFNPKNVSMWNGSATSTVETLSPSINASMLDGQITSPWDHKDNIWFTGASGTIEVTYKDGIKFGSTQITTPEYVTRIGDMDRYGRLHVPGYTPAANDYKSYAVGPVGMVHPPFYDSQTRQYMNNNQDAYLLASNYPTPPAQSFVQTVKDKLKAISNLIPGNPSNLYNYVGPLRWDTANQSTNIDKKFTASYKYFKSPDTATGLGVSGATALTYDVSPVDQQKLSAIGFSPAKPCLNKTYIIQNIGSDAAIGSCECNPPPGFIRGTAYKTTPITIS
jgi:hypothetical protein